MDDILWIPEEERWDYITEVYTGISSTNYIHIIVDKHNTLCGSVTVDLEDILGMMPIEEFYESKQSCTRCCDLLPKRLWEGAY